MLDIKRIRQNPQELRDALKARNKDISIDEFLAQDEKRRALMAQVEEKKALRNAESKKIGEIKKKGGSDEEVAGIMEEMRRVGDEIAAFAKKKKLDIVVMGSHGYGRFKAAIMGSTATRIAATGDVPLLIIRQA